MDRVFVCGDTHGLLDVKKIDKLKSKEKLDYDDYLIICGDCGVVWDKETVIEYTQYFENVGCNVLFVDGNHENFDMLKEYPVEIWNGGKIQKISEHIFHLMRGQVFEILGKTFLTLGGADSSDREWRKEHISWWKDERIRPNDIEEAQRNLEGTNYQVDYVITHTPSIKTLNALVEILTQCGENVPLYLLDKVTSTFSTNMLDFVNDNVKYSQWFCGHLHIDETVEKTQILYEKIVKIK